MTNPRDMPAGRELDALLAEMVMGWRRSDNSVAEAQAAMLGLIEACWGISDDGRLTVARPDNPGEWHPSTDIADAWEVVEEMHARGYGVQMSGYAMERYYFVYIGRGDGQADTAPLAICRAALAAVVEP